MTFTKWVTEGSNWATKIWVQGHKKSTLVVEFKYNTDGILEEKDGRGNVDTTMVSETWDKQSRNFSKGEFTNKQEETNRDRKDEDVSGEVMSVKFHMKKILKDVSWQWKVTG